METNVYTFQDFIKNEIAKGNFSQREFAHKIDVSPTTVGRWLDEINPPKPELAQLVKLSEFTGVGIETLVGLAYPDVADKTRLTPAARLVGQNFERSPKHIQEAIIALIERA